MTFEIKSWCREPEENALVQANNILNHPRLATNVVILPDTHMGYGCPIGCAFGTKDAVIPNAVGVDVACGISACNTKINYKTINLKEIMGKVREAVPTGKTWHKEKQECEDLLRQIDWQSLETVICKQEKDRIPNYVGTMGGGNHFYEFQKDEKDNLWIMIHSGSRNLGKTVCDYYNEKANQMCLRWGFEKQIKDELAFIPRGEKEFDLYFKEMQICMEFSRLNKQRMMQAGLRALSIDYGIDVLDSMHNFATIENHFGKNVIIHRKGATLARDGMTAIIAGSQGTASYIVKGKGNPTSLSTCSHGAGRVMSRKKAKETLCLEEEKKRLDDLGIVHSIRNVSDLEEAPSSYKDIDDVMSQQTDLVDIVHKLLPLGVIKGD